MTGFLLHVDAVVFADAVYCTEMTVASLSAQRGATKEMKMRLVRSFQVLKNTIQKLAQFYEESHTGYRHASDSRHLLPVPCVVAEDTGACVPFKCLDSLKFKDMVFTTQGRAIFKGEITLTKPVPASPSPLLHGIPSTSSALLASQVPPTIQSVQSVQSVYVKFVDCYGDEVHRFLAGEKEKFAPELRWFGEVPGGAFMVVMDEVEGRTVQDYIDHKDSLSNEDLTALDAALARLHDNHFVHGDLRPPNVVMQLNADRSKTAKLIDFDWSRRFGEVWYPKEPLNPKVKWPEEVEEMPGALILYAHDDSMRANLLSQPRNVRSYYTSQQLSAQMPPPTSFERATESLKRALSQREGGGAVAGSSTPSSAKRPKSNSGSYGS